MVLHEGIRPPKFAGDFYKLDFDAEPMPVLSLFANPAPLQLEDLWVDVCGLDCKPRSVRFADGHGLPQQHATAPLVCQIFNWARMVQWGGIRLADFLDYVGLDAEDGDYLTFWSRDGSYFESMPAAMARDPRVLLATSMNGEPLPEDHGGPLRLVVPFLQGYKSVKWLGGIRVLRHDPAGIKRLLGQSKTAKLGKAWRDVFGSVLDDAYDNEVV